MDLDCHVWTWKFEKKWMVHLHLNFALNLQSYCLQLQTWYEPKIKSKVRSNTSGLNWKLIYLFRFEVGIWSLSNSVQGSKSLGNPTMTGRRQNEQLSAAPPPLVCRPLSGGMHIAAGVQNLERLCQLLNSNLDDSWDLFLDSHQHSESWLTVLHRVYRSSSKSSTSDMSIMHKF